VFETLALSIRMTLRGLTRHPAFAAAIVLTIAVAIGANVAIFSVVEAVLLRPLPFPDPARLVIITEHVRAHPVQRLVRPRDVAELRELTDAFEAVEGSRNALFHVMLTAGETPLHVRAERITPGTFDLLGVAPLLGTGFDREFSTGNAPGEEEPPPRRVVIAYELWQRAFGADPRIIGRTVILDGVPAVIGGVMPPRFGIPRIGPGARHYDVELWLPIEADLSQASRGAGTMLVMGRLREGIDPEQARGALEALAKRLQEEIPGYSERGTYFDLYPMHAEIVREVRSQLTVLMGAVGLLLLLACGNVASLLLARGRQRRRETAIMLALGCPRTRLIWSRLAETVALAGIGGLLGLAVGWAGARALELFRPPEFPAITHVSMNWGVVVYALFATVLATLLFGLFPAFRSSRMVQSDALRGGLADSSVGTRRSMRLLVVLETAVAVTLLFGALLLVQTVVGIYQESPGFDLDQTLSFRLRTSASHPDPAERAAVFRDLRTRLAALPGVDAVGATNILPFSGGLWTGAFAWNEASLASVDREEQATNFRIATPGYFAALGARFVAGREFDDAEPDSSVIVDHTLAQLAWPDENPIGKPLMIRGVEVDFVVVGVVEHVRDRQLQMDGRPVIYVTYGFRPLPSISFVLHTSVAPATLAETVRRTVGDTDARLAPYLVAPLRDSVLRSVATTRYVVLVLSGFATVALILAVLGLYGVLAYSVRLRFAELGIRMALGATSQRIFSLVVGEALALAAVGLLLGWAGALSLAGLVQSLFFGVSSTDPTTFAWSAAVLFAAAAFAGGIPARRAARIDPVSALRAE